MIKAAVAISVDKNLVFYTQALSFYNCLTESTKPIFLSSHQVLADTFACSGPEDQAIQMRPIGGLQRQIMWLDTGFTSLLNSLHYLEK